MKLVPKEDDLINGITTVSLVHGNEIPLDWDIAVLDKINNDAEYDIFREINGYWEYLKPDVQDKLFNVYKRIKEVMENVNTVDEITKRLYVLVAELFEYHDLKDVKHWIDYYGGLHIPSSIMEDFKESQESPWTRERTYLKEEYRWLVSLSVALRCMIPVWGDYIAMTKRDHGTQFKEFYAFRLLSYANINRSATMERLRTYVEASLPNDKPSTSSIFGGISSADFPSWMLGLVMVRRLIVGDVRGIDPKVSLASSMHNFIHQRIRGHDSSFIGVVKEKILEGSGQDSENNISRAEAYKSKEPEPQGDISTLDFYAEKPEKMALQLCPTLNMVLLQQSLISTKALETFNITPAQITLLQWVIDPVLKAMGVERLEKLNLINCMAVAQAFLWHHGHFEIAALMTAIPQPKRSVMNVGTTTRSRIPPDMEELIASYYPFSHRPSGKTKLSNDFSGVKTTSQPFEAIKELEKELSNSEWRLTLPDDWVEVLTKNKRSRGYPVPHDIKVKLAVLVIAIAKGSF